MIILYVLLIVYILAINFYAFLLIKSLKEKERAEEIARIEGNLERNFSNAHETFSSDAYTGKDLSSRDAPYAPHSPSSYIHERFSDKTMGKLFITGALGGAITIYVCMFLYKYKRSELLLMVLMPLLGILNIYFWVLLFKSGFHFFILR